MANHEQVAAAVLDRYLPSLVALANLAFVYFLRGDAVILVEWKDGRILEAR